MDRSGDSIPRSSAAAAREAFLRPLVAGQDPSALIVIGVGGGEVLAEIADLLPATNVLALEPSVTVAGRVLARPDVAGRIQQGRLMVLVGPGYAGAADAWRLLEGAVGTPPTFVNPALEQQRPADVARARFSATQVVLGAQHNDEARRKFAGRYLLNTLTNLPVIAAEGNVAALFDVFRGVPALVVAAGPSLDRNIVDLKQLDGRMLIIAVDTAVRPLLAADIHPHLVVSVDPSDVNARHLDDLPDTRGMWLVAEGSLHPTVFPTFAGRTFTFKVSHHHPWPWLASQGLDRGRLQAWGSVLTTAFDLACRLGCGPIVFAGADLAYTDGLLYCRNTVYEPEWSHLHTDDARAEFFELAYFADHPTCVEDDLRGGGVRSAPRFIQFRDWLVARADAVGDRQIVNATEGGILHGGRILQSRLAVALADLQPLPRSASPTLRLEAVWQAGRTEGAATRVRHGLDRLLRRQERQHDQLQDWAQFAKDTVTGTEIAARADFALRGLTNIHRGRSSQWTADLTELMQNLELATRLDLARRERDDARVARDSAIAERDAATRARDAAQRERAEDFLGHYSTWRTHRLRVLMEVWRRLNFRGATVLELGCGHGDIGAFFLSMGAEVTFLDARDEHLAVVRTRYPGATTLLHDANLPLQPPNGEPYDYVIHMGLLYHLRPDAVAASIANACELGRHVVLDSQVCDSDDPTLIVETRESGFDQAVDGVGCRPSAALIERVLNDRGVRWRRHDDPRLNTYPHVYDWKSLNNGRYFALDAVEPNPFAVSDGIRRFYTIETT